MREQHDAWRERRLTVGGDVALHWYFTRQLSGYRKRSKEVQQLCDLNANFLVSLYHKQEGRCYFTGTDLQWQNYGHGVARPDSLSVDRLDPTKGYVQNNVVLCIYFVNTAKGRLSEESFYSFCQKVLDYRSVRRTTGET